MKIAMLGTGVVGAALGAGLVARGDEVMMGTRDPQSGKAREWVNRTGARASAGTFEAAARFGEMAFLATSWSGTESALQLAGPTNLSGKIVVDCTNPLVALAGGAPGLAMGHSDSGGETVQRRLPGAKVVKAFNIVGAAHMVHPKFAGGPPDMFICGNDEGARKVVAGICRGFGWEVVDVGGIEGARLLEPLALLWINHGFRSGSWNHAWKLLRA